MQIFRVSSALLAGVMMLAAISGTAVAAKPDKVDREPGGGGKTSEPYGLDVSWPQCGRTLPTDQAFAIVGVNGGLANTTNPCLADQLAWGSESSGSVDWQPELQLYVNTANPSGLGTPSWPRDNIDPAGDETYNPYGTYDVDDKDEVIYSIACAWQYGWNRAVEDATIRLKPAAAIAQVGSDAGEYTWWLDVETENSWLEPTNEENLESNVAVLEGMTAYFVGIGATVGLYSTAYQWNEITGGWIDDDSNLIELANWRPSGTRLSTAQNNCSLAPLTTDGFISLTQYVKKNLDHNYACPLG